MKALEVGVVGAAVFSLGELFPLCGRIATEVAHNAEVVRVVTAIQDNLGIIVAIGAVGVATKMVAVSLRHNPSYDRPPQDHNTLG